ncbi:glycosyltransferase family 4 protein [Marinilabilia salmonicolor]|uniref:Glycosyltransferase involved in cell wall biosynthesis n=1 Tax=Marinilabilia salmonicolor TaxID=989 RepID=A0A368UJ74_9BACT|nr:glycosyltransferase family 4 protein [Marinilabilia salmonicolor]RCW27033.1 glycosyltransferase involved in cell wall biosynthesis [Marinilabilia salmonicolor]
MSKIKNVAILCCGLDTVRRGYETHTRVLFNELQQEQECRFILFKRDGEQLCNEIPLKSPYRYGFLCQKLKLLRGDHLYWESVFFSLYFFIHTLFYFKRFNTISCIEPMTAKVLYFLKFWLPGKPQIILTHGVTNTPAQIYFTADKIHQVNIENYLKMEDYCKKHQLKNKQVLIPHFLTRLPPIKLTNDEIREKYKIPNGNILLSVGAIEAVQKRTKYIFQEFENLPNNWILVVCGKIQDKNLHQKFKNRLKERYINLYLPNAEMKYLYKIATIFVQASINEGFGMVLLEAMRQGLPCFAHNRPLFKWILKSETTLVNMNNKNELSSRIINLEKELSLIGKHQFEIFNNHFEWEKVKSDYKNLLI